MSPSTHEDIVCKSERPSANDKGKGKAIDLSEEEKPESPPKSETDSEYEEDTRKAIALSLQEKKGESSKRSWSKEDSPVGFDMDKLAIYIQD